MTLLQRRKRKQNAQKYHLVGKDRKVGVKSTYFHKDWRRTTSTQSGKDMALEIGKSRPIIDETTEKAMEVEVQDLLRDRGGSCTLLELASALAGSDRIRQHYADQRGKNWNMEQLGRRIKSLFTLRKFDTPIMRRYELTFAFNRVEQSLGAGVIRVDCWENARDLLSPEIVFPARAAQSDISVSEPAAVNSAFSQLAVIPYQQREIASKLEPSDRKWKQISATSLPKKISEEREKEMGKLDEDIRARLEKHEEAKKSKVAAEVEKRLAEKEKEEEAKKLASSLLRELTPEEEEIVYEAMHGHGPSNEVVHSLGPDSVQRASMHRLQPGQWLNDEVIHYFYVMLGQRDEEMCRQDPTRKRSHFFKSFFMTKLLNEGNAELEGTYEYRNVKRWSKKVPGKDIFNLDKIFFPINQGRMHWICAVAFMQEKRIQFYDSMG
jgi:hypothetical protein